MGVHVGAIWWIWLIHPCAVVMRPCVKLLWPLVIIWQTNSEAPHLAAYTSYIDHELKEADPVRVLCIFERAVVDNCLQPDLWIRYVKYVVCIGTFCCIYLLFSERELTLTFAVCYRPSICLSSVCNARAPYSGGWNFRQYFYGIGYLSIPFLFLGGCWTKRRPGLRLMYR